MYDIAYNVLFVDSSNSTCSLMAERILNATASGRFTGFSCGIRPAPTVHPMTTLTLRQLGVPAEGLHCKGFEEFVTPTSPVLDFVFRIGETPLPVENPWNGEPLIANWLIADPGIHGLKGDRARVAFRTAAFTIKRRIELMLALPPADLEALAAIRDVDDIGRH